MKLTRGTRIVLYLAVFLLTLGVGVAAYFHWPLVALLVVFFALSGSFVFGFPRDSFLTRLLVGTTQLGLIAGVAIAMFALDGYKKQEGPTLEEMANSSDPEAQYMLGLIEIFREGDEENNLLLSSARKGNGKAQHMLGLMIAKNGLNPEYAYMMFKLADDNGVEEAATSIDMIIGSMSKKQIAKGRELYSDWLKKFPDSVSSSNKS